ncbi:sensor histidine kinase [Mycetocola spongiae]|uniref:sensor histidine kinase n=1 Tax=Mycetocola spongiae TaxID=2859226 RepID=UPI001CF45DE0|nr:HAMP domain-containing sensor histidine kinase [Mycetocola spongiae]UCR88099.1 HAMP domain-containing histidine kinase [Mycetocola spongiae]
MSRPRPRISARARLTLSYALFVMIAGAVALAVIFVVMRFIPDYPLSSAQFPEMAAASRGEIMSALLNASVLAMVLLAVIGLGAGWFISGRVLRPLQNINDAARRAAEGSLGHRIALTGPRDEFTDLSDTFDHMLDRLQASFEAQRRFSANASHELRTPLAISRTMLEVARADPAHQDYDVLTARLLEVNERGSRIVTALLALSEIGSARLVPLRLDLAAIAEEAASTVAGEARLSGRELRLAMGPAPVSGDADLLRQLTQNLLENALRHGEGAVMLGVENAPGGAILTVDSGGAVLDPERIHAFFEPFMRGGGRLAATAGAPRGHGLGLALVRQIAAAHGAEVTATPGEAGGLRMRVVFPAISG